jgi:hypothetical protein
MILLLLSGKAESGKDTVWEIIERNYKKTYFDVQKFSFADAVKSIAFDLGWDGEKDAQGRRLLQWLGDGARDYDPLCWIKFLYRQLSYEVRNTDIAVITDCRYPNEITYFKDKFLSGAYSVRIERPGHVNRLDEIQRKHSSETSLDCFDFDFYLMNSSTLEDLEKKTITLVERIKKMEGQEK